MYAILIIPAQVLSRDLCIVQAALNEILTMANVLWVDFITLEMYNVVIRQRCVLQFGLYKPLILIYILSIIACVPPAILNYYGPAGAWCYTYANRNNGMKASLIKISVSFGIFWLVFVLSFIASLRISSKLKKYLVSEENQIMVKIIKYYPVILMAINIPITVSRLLEGSVKIPESYLIFSEIVVSCEGLFNLIVYGNNNEVKPSKFQCKLIHIKIFQIVIEKHFLVPE